MMLLYGRNLMDTLHERVGEETDVGVVEADNAGDRPDLGWVRVIGLHGQEDGDPLGVYGSGPGFDYTFGALQGGFDLLREDHADGSRDHAGVTFALGGAGGTVTHFDGTTGVDRFAAYSLGGYWTHFDETGWYLDGVVQGTLYDASTTADRGFEPFTTTGLGLAASLEAGKPFRFDEGWVVEPQGQIVYQLIDIADGEQPTSGNHALVTFSDAESLVGRIGARIGRTWSLDGTPDGQQITAWVRPNLWHEFLGETTTTFSSAEGPVAFRSGIGGTWGELNLGLSGQLDPNTTLFANGTYGQRLDGTGSAFDLKVGLRGTW
jgi:outer membrane autotransporter protein